jgi:class 3 adenylate cyclase
MNQTATLVVVFCDLVESTALMTAVGDDEADRIRRELFGTWRFAVEDAGGTLVKFTGDGFMAVFQTSVGNAIGAVDALRVATEKVEAPRRLRLRVGIAAGEALNEDNDWYGTPVVEAARLCSAADPDEVLVSETARRLVGSRGGHEFTLVGRLELKGLAEPVPTYALGSRARRRRRRTPTKWIATGVATALVIGAAVVAVEASRSDNDRASSRAVPAPRGYTPTLTDRPCTADESAGDSTVRCQTLEVPENRHRPKGPTVKLPVVRASATDPRVDMVPTLSIGPTLRAPSGDPLRGSSALIWLGARGRRGSIPQLTCVELDGSRQERMAMRWEDSSARQDADLTACLDRLQASGVDLNQYDEGDAADDVRDLAFALREPSISLRATFDAARAALVVMRRYPGLLQSVILNDSMVPPFSAIGGVPISYNESLMSLSRLCDASIACKAQVPNGLVAAVDAMRERLAANPEPVTVPVVGGNAQVLLDDGHFMEALALGLGSSQDVLALIPAAVVKGDPAPFASFLQSSFANYESGQLYLTEWCAEDVGRFTKSELQAQAAALPRWRSLVHPRWLDLCEQFAIDQVPDLTTPAASSVPVFIVQGALTPWGSRSDLSTFAAALSHASLLVLPNRGLITASAPPCVDSLQAEFLESRTARLETKSCAASDPPLRFATT